MAKRKTASEPTPSSTLWKYVAWTLAAGAWVIIGAALISYDPADAPGHRIAPFNDAVHNWIGRFGAVVAHETYLLIGPGVWIAMVSGLAALITVARGRRITQPILRSIGVVLMTLAVSAMIGLTIPGFGDRPEGAGGLIAVFFNTELQRRFAWLGAALILLVAFWLGAILAVDQLVLALPKMIGHGFGAAVSRVHWPNPVLVGKLPALFFAFAPKRPFRRRETDLDENPEIPIRHSTQRAELAVMEPPPVESDSDEDEWEYEYEDADDESHEIEDAHDAEDKPLGDAPGAYIEQKKEFDAQALREKIGNLPINMAAPFAGAASAPPREMDLSGYEFPDIGLLEDPESNFTEEMEALVRDQALQLEQALNEYRIEGQVVGIDSGPAITLYEVRLAPGTKVSRISAVSSDLARAMRVQNLRIVPNIAGKDTIGVEAPNLKKEKVRLKELMTLGGQHAGNMKLPMFLGKDASGNPLIADLAAAPHLLIAGTTGSGKSVCMNAIIMSFLYTKRPDEMKLVLVDPKMVEMSQFKNVPHLMCPVVTEMSRAAAILEWAVGKMDERYELLAETGVRDIGSYNALGWEEIVDRINPATQNEEARIPKKLPYLVFIIDELADLMMTQKEVETFIVRIAQKARAVGIHLILATQRPQANVVTGLIKSNMPSRISFKVASGMDSRIVLDHKGAELLLGHGDMLYLSPRSTELTRAQGTLVDDFEVRKTVRFLKKVAEQQFEPQLVQLKRTGLDVDAQRDPLFEDAVEIVLETQRGSVSLLQRRLSIGYSRASRLIEEIAAAGVIGEYKGSQAREVNMTLEQWEKLRAEMHAQASTQPETNADNRAASSLSIGAPPVEEAEEEETDEDEEYEYEEGADTEEEEEEEEESDEYEYVYEDEEEEEEEEEESA